MILMACSMADAIHNGAVLQHVLRLARSCNYKHVVSRPTSLCSFAIATAVHTGLVRHAAETVNADAASDWHLRLQVEVVTPEEHMGDVIGDLNSRRGVVHEFAESGNMKVVKASVPLSEMFQYVSTLRGMTKGRAQYTMQLEKYDVVPPNIQENIVRENKVAA